MISVAYIAAGDSEEMTQFPMTPERLVRLITIYLIDGWDLHRIYVEGQGGWMLALNPETGEAWQWLDDDPC